MRWFFRLFRRQPRASIARGLLIPQPPHALAKPPVRTLALRPVTALVAVCAVGFFVYTEAATFVDTRLSQPASPVIVATQTEPYQHVPLREGALPALQDSNYYTTLLQQLAAEESVVVGVDIAAERIAVYQDGTVVLSAPIRALATRDSWRYVTAGYYTVDRITDERYSGLEQVYYTNVVALTSRIALHGPSINNHGAVTQTSPLGVQLAESDAASLAALVYEGVPVLVHTTEEAAHAPRPALQPRGPALPVRSYLAVELDSDTTLASANAETVVPIASLTKLMTALVVAAEYDLEGEVVIDQEQYVTTLVPRLPGTTRTSVYDLLQLLLLESSNEAAEVLASMRGREQFIAQMNEYATEFGLHHTTFTDPSGLDDGNRSTAADILTLTRLLDEQYPFILRMTARAGLVTARRQSDFTDLENFNSIDDVDTFIGGKIGETDAARQTSVTLHDIDFGGSTRTVVLIVLGSESRNADVTTLHEYVATNYYETQ